MVCPLFQTHTSFVAVPNQTTPLAFSFTSCFLRCTFPASTIRMISSLLLNFPLAQRALPSSLAPCSNTQQRRRKGSTAELTHWWQNILWFGEARYLYKRVRRPCPARHLLNITLCATSHPLLALKPSQIFMWLLQREHFWSGVCKGWAEFFYDFLWTLPSQKRVSHTPFLRISCRASKLCLQQVS